jgi:hypothetical protein
MGGQEYDLFWIGAFGLGHFVKQFYGMHLPMPQWVFGLIIGSDDNGCKIILSEHGSPEYLVSFLNFFPGQGYDISFHHRQKPIDELRITSHRICIVLRLRAAGGPNH